MSAKRCTWAAKNGVKNAVRVALRFDDRAERLERIVNGSANTNDNTIFRELLVNIKRGAILVFDAGFNKLSIIRELVSRGYHFVSVKSKTYQVQMVKKLSLPKNREVAPQWELIDDQLMMVGSSSNPARARYRVLTFKHRVTKEILELFTDLFTFSPKVIFAMYHRRWRIEVIFRWLKSEFALFLTRYPLSMRKAFGLGSFSTSLPTIYSAIGISSE